MFDTAISKKILHVIKRNTKYPLKELVFGCRVSNMDIERIDEESKYQSIS